MLCGHKDKKKCFFQLPVIFGGGSGSSAGVPLHQLVSIVLAGSAWHGHGKHAVVTTNYNNTLMCCAHILHSFFFGSVNPRTTAKKNIKKIFSFPSS